MPFEPFPPPTPPTDWRQIPQPAPQPDHFGNGVQAIGQGVRRYRAMGVAIVAAKAASNAYEQTGDPVVAARVGASAFARWMVWVFCIMWGTLMTLFIMAFVSRDAGGVAPLIATIAVWPFALGVTWCRNVDFCLFRRGAWYRLFQPVALLCEKVSMPVLYLSLLLPVFLTWQMVKW